MAQLLVPGLAFGQVLSLLPDRRVDIKPPQENLLACFEADAGLTLSGDKIVSWADTSGAGHMATTQSGTPVLSPNTYNGLPAVRLEGAAGMDIDLDIGLDLNTAPFTIYLVYSRGAVQGQRVLAGKTQNWLMGPYSGGYDYYNDGGFIYGPPAVVGVPACHTVVQSAGAAASYVNNVLVGTNVPGTLPRLLVLGARNPYSEPANSDVCGIYPYATAHDAAARAAVAAYILQKWGV